MAKIRKLTVEFAKKGSPQAEGFVREYLEKMDGSENINLYHSENQLHLK